MGGGADLRLPARPDYKEIQTVLLFRQWVDLSAKLPLIRRRGA
jgi:hypothetical protein